MPKTMLSWFVATRRPRRCPGEISTMYSGTTTLTPPMANPPIKRNQPRACGPIALLTGVNAHPTAFLRCHSSHFVNPNHVKSLRRFAVTMPGDQELPIPEKHYTAFKRALAEALGSKSDQGGKRPAPGDP